jgi:hypothetical protein
LGVRDVRNVQYWPKVTHAMKRTSQAGCNACDARFRRVLHRICYSNVAHMKRASCVQHLRGMCAGYVLLRQHVTHACHTCGMRTSDAFVARVSSIHVLQMSRTSSAWEVRGTMGYIWSVLYMQCTKQPVYFKVPRVRLPKSRWRPMFLNDKFIAVAVQPSVKCNRVTPILLQDLCLVFLLKMSKSHWRLDIITQTFVPRSI